MSSSRSRQPSWSRWALLANGAVIAIFGAGYLLAQRMSPASRHAAADPHAWVGPAVAMLLLATGATHALVAAFRRRLSDAVLVPMTALGMMSFIPTSIVLGLVTLAELLREGEARGR